MQVILAGSRIEAKKSRTSISRREGVGISGLRANEECRKSRKQRKCAPFAQTFRFRARSIFQVAYTRQRRRDDKCKKQTTFLPRLFYVLLGARSFALQNGRPSANEQTFLINTASLSASTLFPQQRKTSSH